MTEYAPSHSDRFVRVTAYLSDQRFGYDRWLADQFSGRAGYADYRPAVLVICRNKDEQDDCLAFLEARRAEKEASAR
jgi:hypothetical protein